MVYTLESAYGWSSEIEAEDLDDAKKQADEEITYNQNDYTISDADGDVVCTRRWWGCLDGIEEQEDPIQFGDFGFYSDWE